MGGASHPRPWEFRLDPGAARTFRDWRFPSAPSPRRPHPVPGCNQRPREPFPREGLRPERGLEDSCRPPREAAGPGRRGELGLGSCPARPWRAVPAPRRAAGCGRARCLAARRTRPPPACLLRRTGWAAGLGSEPALRVPHGFLKVPRFSPFWRFPLLSEKFDIGPTKILNCIKTRKGCGPGPTCAKAPRSGPRRETPAAGGRVAQSPAGPASERVRSLLAVDVIGLGSGLWRRARLRARGAAAAPNFAAGGNHLGLKNENSNKQRTGKEGRGRGEVEAGERKRGPRPAPAHGYPDLIGVG